MELNDITWKTSKEEELRDQIDHYFKLAIFLLLTLVIINDHSRRVKITISLQVNCLPKINNRKFTF